jgi:adenylate kinase family enzyme
MLPDIILLDGPVGSGKGTQAHLLSQKFGYYQFGFGTELREFVSTYTQDPENPNYAKALEIEKIFKQGNNVSAEDLFAIAGEKIISLVKNNQKIVIDSAKNLEAFEWLAEICQNHDLSGLLIQFDLDITVAKERLSHRYYAPHIKDLPFNSYEEALKHCIENETPTRRQDDQNVERIVRQYELYTENKPKNKEILTEIGMFDYLEISSFESIKEVFDKILECLESYQE